MTTQMDGSHDQYGDHDGRGNLDSFQVLEGGMEPGDYDAYVGLMDRATLQRLNSPDDFFSEAKFPTEEYGDVVLGYYELGLEQLYARCNNREAEVEYLRSALKYLDDCKDAGRPIDSKGVSVVMIAELEILYRRGKWKKGLKKTAKGHNKTLDTLLQGIAYDKKLGVYRDYTDVRRKWQAAMQKKESVMGAAVGDILQDMPYFFQEAVAMSRRTESNTRRPHIQALMARVTETVSDMFAFRGAQNNMGANTSRGRRRFLGGGKREMD